jgi:hypothetical protein
MASWFLEDIFNKLGFTADLQIDDLQAMEITARQIDRCSKCGRTVSRRYEGKWRPVGFDLDGSYTASVNDASLDMELALNRRLKHFQHRS